MEKFRGIFPRHGNFFSMVWKIRATIFHGVENQL